MAARIESQSEPFDFAEYLFLLERVLPKRSKARKLIPELEEYVAELRRRTVRPWESDNLNNGTDREHAQTALFESCMKIDPRWRTEFCSLPGPTFSAWSLRHVPKGVVKEVEKLLRRERSFGYIKNFITLRLKGEVTLTDKAVPVEGGMYALDGAA